MDNIQLLFGHLIVWPFNYKRENKLVITSLTMHPPHICGKACSNGYRQVWQDRRYYLLQNCLPSYVGMNLFLNLFSFNRVRINHLLSITLYLFNFHAKNKIVLMFIFFFLCLGCLLPPVVVVAPSWSSCRFIVLLGD